MSPDAPETAAPPGRRASLRRRALSGMMWTLVGNGGGQALRLVSNLILTRLLFPSAFGLISIVSMLNVGLQMMTDVGMRPAVIQHQHGDDQEFLDTAWSIQILRGFLLWGLGLALAVPMARFYREPVLVPLIAVATFRAVIDGFNSTKLLTLTRHIELARMSIIGLVSKTSAIVAMVALAWYFRSVWALVLGGLVQDVVELVLSHVAIPGPGNRIRWNRQFAWEIYRFGRWILASTLFTFLSRRIDVVMLGRLVPMAVLGVYSVGIMISSVPERLFTLSTQAILMPGLAEIWRERAQLLSAKLAESKRLLLPAGALCVVGCVAVAPAFFRYLYDPRYWAAGWIAQLSMLPFWFLMLHDLNGRVLLVFGDSRSVAVSNAVKTFVSLGACLGGFFLWGLPGVLLGLGLGGACAYATVAIALRSHGVGTQRLDLGTTAACAVLASLCAAAPHLWGAPADIDRVAWSTMVAGALLLLPLGTGFGLYAWRTVAR